MACVINTETSVQCIHTYIHLSAVWLCERGCRNVNGFVNLPTVASTGELAHGCTGMQKAELNFHIIAFADTHTNMQAVAYGACGYIAERGWICVSINQTYGDGAASQCGWWIHISSGFQHSYALRISWCSQTQDDVRMRSTWRRTNDVICVFFFLIGTYAVTICDEIKFT